MNESEAMECPKCGMDISDKYANYCPYCAEPLGKLRRKKYKALFWWGVAFTLIGVIIVVLVPPQSNRNFGIFAVAPIELWIAGVIDLLVGIVFIVASYLETGGQGQGRC